MTVTVFCIIWAGLSVLTGLVTQAIKDFISTYKENYPSNIIALIVALVLGAGVSIVYYLQNGIPFTALNVIYIIAIGLLNWVGATVGYDKVKQAVLQLMEGSVSDGEENQ